MLGQPELVKDQLAVEAALLSFLRTTTSSGNV